MSGADIVGLVMALIALTCAIWAVYLWISAHREYRRAKHAYRKAHR